MVDHYAKAEDVVAEARCWLGTPYQHQASVCGAGADCLGLIRGVWRALIGGEPEEMPGYTPDWSEIDRVERLHEGAARHLIQIAPPYRAGDVLLFRVKGQAVAKHLAILSDATPDAQRIIHAYSGHGVVESPLGPAWGRRIVAGFRFPVGRN
ncbi:putative phage cell wall peptidase, NlpC/P60 family [Monaibacterium marinum]|uniref:Putative phage cell wall peptidase, NlpC/P60 family n=1 Tax=Pontivivens marinum TaxID=1690039 RepID=A0A2C9CTG2_9RHOB|nr:NlpC/P60 family protein [Monaibacterium marinum]SOH94503.1 putative phage cell wall peptidase, NlpC/P60 family [Monaibacterium marinum]